MSFPHQMPCSPHAPAHARIAAQTPCFTSPETAKVEQYRDLLKWEKEFNADVSRLRAPVERAIAHIKSWRILHTDYRRPLATYLTSFRAAIGLYFFKLYF